MRQAPQRYRCRRGGGIRAASRSISSSGVKQADTAAGAGLEALVNQMLGVNLAQSFEREDRTGAVAEQVVLVSLRLIGGPLGCMQNRPCSFVVPAFNSRPELPECSRLAVLLTCVQ